MGRTWQPFGGSGYLILWALLALVLVLSAALILAPLALRRDPRQADQNPAAPRGRVFAYFGLLGIAFLFVEIPLIQRWILLLGHATYAFAAVVLSLLLFSGLGSLLTRAAWLPRRGAWVALVLMALLTPLLVVRLADAALGWPLWARAAVAVIGLAPLGVLMGLPFPRGVAWLEDRAPQLIPWAWAVNGAASVVASVLAAILALSSGFTVVLLLGAGCYAAAGIVLSRSERVRLSKTDRDLGFARTGVEASAVALGIERHRLKPLRQKSSEQLLQGKSASICVYPRHRPAQKVRYSARIYFPPPVSGTKLTAPRLVAVSSPFCFSKSQSVCTLPTGPMGMTSRPPSLSCCPSACGR